VDRAVWLCAAKLDEKADEMPADCWSEEGDVEASWEVTVDEDDEDEEEELCRCLFE